MADTGLALPGTAASVGTVSAWFDPSNCCTATDSSYAYQGGGGSKQVSDALSATNFGFSVPADGTITGVLVRIRRAMKSGSAGEAYTDNSVRLSVAGSASGSNLAKPDAWTTTKTSVDYGGAGQVWGLALTPEIVNSAAFGVELRANRTKEYGYVYTIWMQIFFEVAGNMLVRDGGTWKPGQVMVRDGSIWKPGKAMVRDGGVWK